ncbi:MAG TPA: LytTR family DNA-binding domain-containing protein [Vicinamibacterales bacterium]|nr:LytTR family DNA-binding domain-containing protein [Vicinamibacterales bacterium]
MNALLVDDERLARQELRRLLASHADVTIVGEAVNVDDAVARLADPSIDLVFLDIQMPGGSGFDVLERLDRVPLVVFTTAFDEYAVRAFEVNAFDYLMKPIRTDRLTAVLEKARAVLTPGRTERPGPSSERVFLRDGERCWIVPWADIALFEVEGNYARAYFGGNRPLIRVALNSLEARLDPALFFRASRQHIVNLRFIESVETAPDDSYIIRLKNRIEIPVSRRQSRQLRESLGL